MKKDYESPKAEKMEFDYSEVVVASGQCKTGGDYSEYGANCKEQHSEYQADVV